MAETESPSADSRAVQCHPRLLVDTRETGTEESSPLQQIPTQSKSNLWVDLWADYRQFGGPCEIRSG
jgi:hypothetical protein